MSSDTVRDKFKEYLGDENQALTIYDLSEHYDSKNFPKEDEFLAVDFLVSDERQIQIPNDFREEGRILVHYMYKKKGDLSSILAKVEPIRAQFRGKRVNGLGVDNVGTPKTGNDSLKLAGVYTAVTFYVDYYFDFQGE